MGNVTRRRLLRQPERAASKMAAENFPVSLFHRQAKGLGRRQTDLSVDARVLPVVPGLRGSPRRGGEVADQFGEGTGVIGGQGLDDGGLLVGEAEPVDQQPWHAVQGRRDDGGGHRAVVPRHECRQDHRRLQLSQE